MSDSLIPISDEQAKLGQEALKTLRGLGSFLAQALGSTPEDVIGYDSVQLTAKHPVATPVNWKPGQDVIIAGSAYDEDAQKHFPGFRAPKPYLRYTAQPR